MSRAYGATTSITRSPTGSVVGSRAARRARSTPYRAINSVALAVNAADSAGVQAGSSAWASSLRTLLSIASDMRHWYHRRFTGLSQRDQR